jgi:hypothetical protein
VWDSPCEVIVASDDVGPDRVHGIVMRWLLRHGPVVRARMIVLLASAAILAGCQTDVTVGVRQVLDGTGEVTVTLLLDREAAQQSGDLRKIVRTADLEGAGWDITGPSTPSATDGSVTYLLTKTFRNSGEAQLILVELSGEEGPFNSLVVDRTRSPLRITNSISGAVDLSKGYDAFGDQVIARQFQTESPLGLNAQDIQKRFNRPLEELVPLHLDVQFNDEPLRRVELKSGQRTAVSVRSVVWNRLVLFPMGAAGLGLVGLLISFRRRRNED